ncbi:MAG: PepSY domain-containing protein [Actinobacteria bacterium]|nr:PepSY domain-containing protein [Actinomycetota bacterium]
MGVGTVLAAGALAGGAVAYGSGDSDENITGRRAVRPIEAALQATGGGTVNSVEMDGENGATWEVEVTRPDGPTVGVRLDEKYQVVVIEGDSETSDNND